MNVKLFERTNYTVDLPRLVAECRTIVDRVGFNANNQIGLVNPRHIAKKNLFTFSTGKLQDTPGFAEESFTEFHPDYAGSYLHEVYQSLPYRVGRFRIMNIPWRGCYSIHRDFGARVHIALITHPGAYMLFPEHGEFLHIPADGHAWWTETRVPHTAMNTNLEDRWHLVGCILD